MITWLRENPQGKQGRNTYTLEEFRLTTDAINQHYDEYNNMFLKHRESSDTYTQITKNENSTIGNIDIVTKST
jgi:hypothetical protein